ncbi:N-acetyllactosaminide beta-1,3-N-acetylglucosaminyltransferase 2 [Acipenser ruthenus]|uniref:Hexosyltransferase n=1 Tax=Acipenser ruthenus TaxID=7906 RepID=A0A444US94_ACIRT|nr:N-acetyllactosaminide beta-1,3-N-acetylglucosaminyltransferase 2 [Acipenser ruthenus]RXM91030.1 N-acetyllactosaminide beta-1,3-N-acetylglucosaminyltransferase 2 [Acipenser ruthenus]
MSLIYKKILLWLLCSSVANLLLYTFLSLSSTSPDGTSQARVRPRVLKPDGVFWKLSLDESALWNHLQHALDRAHNPILRNGTPSRAVPRLSGLCQPNPGVSTRVRDFNTLPRRVKDFVVSMHCRDYRLVIDQPGLCKGERPTLLLAIKSQVANFENRQAIRESWGRAGRIGNATVKRVFLLGRQDPDSGHFPDLTGLLELERRRHGDLLLWDFKDTFFNLTLKDVLFLKWLGRRCPGARYVFKGDDDVFLNTEALLGHLESRSNESRDLFLGQVIRHAAPLRKVKQKYYVPKSLYEGGYPAYVGGGGMVYSGDLALRLGRASDRVVLFPIDDVYMGMCLEKLGVSPTEHPGFRTFDISEGDRDNPCVYRTLVLVHRRTPREVIRLWKRMHDPELKC